jgi:predicted transcriptional regulator
MPIMNSTLENLSAKISSNEKDKISIKDRIIKIIHELVMKNSIIDFSRLYHLCLREFKLEGITILEALDELSKEKRIIFGQKIIRDFVLVNPIRKTIYTYIKNNPGIHFAALYKELDQNPHFIRWNLSVLLRFDCIIEIKIKNENIYAIQKIPYEYILTAFILRNKKMRQILSLLLQSPYSLTDLAQMTSISYDTVLYQTKVLEQKKILIPSLQLDKKVYQISSVFLPHFRTLCKTGEI